MNSIDSCVVIFFLLFLAMAVVLIMAVRTLSNRAAMRNAALAEQAAREGEEKRRVYEEAWAAARASDNIDALVRCGEYLVKATRTWQPQLLELVASNVYEEFLGRLKENPNLKPTALAMGRAAYAARRPDGVLSVYDEQAIQNDILAHIG